MKYVLLLSGKINSGKNKYAELLKNQFEDNDLNVRLDLYAKNLKDYSSEDFKLLGDVMYDIVSEIKANLGLFINLSDNISLDIQDVLFTLLDKFTFTKSNFYEDKTEITRALLQIYGTDIARKRFDDRFWIKKMAERINNDTESDVIIVTDVRFPNEIDDIYEYLDDCRVVPIRIERDLDRNHLINEHESETALDDYTFWEFIIDNNGTLKDLEDSSVIIADDIMNLPEL